MAGEELPADDMEQLEDGGTLVLSDLLNHVFDKGIVIAGSVTIGIADIDLVRLSLDLVISSVETDLRRTRGRGKPRVGGGHGDVPVLPSSGSE